MHQLPSTLENARLRAAGWMFVFCTFAASLGCGSEVPTRGEPERRQQGSARAPRGGAPNVLIFLLDDVGFGQLSSYGGPIRTPNIDRVAARGVRYTNFHTTALCSPSRAALLTGRNHHSVGTGKIIELALNEPGYTARIPKSAGTFAEALRQDGYSTYAFGKWHNTPMRDASAAGPFDLWPTGLGFEHFYGFLGADTSNWAPPLWRDTTPVDPYFDDPRYHLTSDLADHVIATLTAHAVHRGSGPFLVYLATGTAHAPHHAPREWIDANKGRFDEGWDRVRAATFARQQALGIVPAGTVLPERARAIPAWDSLSPDERRLFARMQEVYAAALEHADHEFGRVLDALERAGASENTIVIVASDNGASGEGGLAGSYNEMRAMNGLREDLALNLGHIDQLGGPEAYNHYPAGWALAGNTPGRYWKQTAHEGGVRDPLIIAWPAGIAARGEIRPQFVHVTDIAPTLLELTGAPAPDSVDGVPQMPYEGASFAATLASASVPSPRRAQYFEMFANRGIWSDGWKAVTFHGRFPWDIQSAPNPNYDADVWELYRVDDDPGETRDLAASNPAKLAELKALFEVEAAAHHVYPLSDSTIPPGAAATPLPEYVYRGVTTRTPEALSPRLKGRSHTIVARVLVPTGGADGVLATCGGRFGGYSLYVKDGRLVYTNNFVGEQITTITSQERIPAGSAELEFVFESAGRYSGVGRLYVNGQPSGSAPIPRTAPVAYSLNETFDTGIDTGTAAGEYVAPFPYRGTLIETRVTIDDLTPASR